MLLVCATIRIAERGQERKEINFKWKALLMVLSLFVLFIIINYTSISIYLYLYSVINYLFIFFLLHYYYYRYYYYYYYITATKLFLLLFSLFSFFFFFFSLLLLLLLWHILLIIGSSIFDHPPSHVNITTNAHGFHWTRTTPLRIRTFFFRFWFNSVINHGNYRGRYIRKQNIFSARRQGDVDGGDDLGVFFKNW